MILRLMRSVAFHNWQYKLGAVAIAVGMYSFVHFEQNSQIAMRLDIRWTGVAEDRMILDDTIPEIKVVLDGPGTLLRQVQNQTMIYEASASTLELGRNLLSIDATQLRIPRGVAVRRITPSSIEVDYVEVERFELPVRIQYTGEIASGYKLANLIAEPSKVEVFVVAGQLNPTSVLLSKELDLTGRSGSFDFVLDLDTSNLKVKELRPAKIQARAEIVPSIATMVLEDVPVYSAGSVGSSDIDILPETVSITISGSEKDLKRYEQSAAAKIVVDEIPGRATPFKVEMDIEGDIQIDKIAPEFVVVREREK
jgi:hypothetical protein